MPTVSVCLASFNGEKFIKEQLTSILSQISASDEVIIVDDASTDKTLKIVNDIEDYRIKVFPLQQNVGHVKAFERAITFASNEIIFLSDQDDVWFPEKYQRVIEEFSLADRPVLVVHSLAAIGDAGEVLSLNWLSLPKACLTGVKFLSQEFLKPSIFGSASAFKSSLLGVLLPFPKYAYAHDHWLGICAAITGKSKILDVNFVYRRIHADNLTPEKGLKYTKRFYSRLLFVRMVFLALYRACILACKNRLK